MEYSTQYFLQRKGKLGLQESKTYEMNNSFFSSQITSLKSHSFFSDLKIGPIFSLNKIFPKVKKILLLKKQTFQKENISRNFPIVFFQSKILFRLKKAAQNISQNLRPYSPNIPENVS